MTAPTPAELKSLLVSLSPQDKQAVLATFHGDELEEIRTDWPLWARANQLPPESPPDWHIWLYLAGRGTGKTRAGAEYVRAQVTSGRWARVALVGETVADARDVMVLGESGLIEIAPRNFRPTYIPSRRLVEWPNGAKAWTYSADDPEQLRGPQHEGAWCLIPGTPVLMADGTTKPIERIRAGDAVQTRTGPALVQSCASRITPLTTVTFADGRTLTGSPDHPIQTEHGWTPLARVKPGDRASLCLWKNEIGDQTAKATGTATSAARSSTGTVRSGSRRTDPFRRVTTCITRTMSKATTAWRIYPWLLRLSIAAFIRTQPELAGARSAASSTPINNARSTAPTVVPKPLSAADGSPSGPVAIAEPSSRLEVGTIAVSAVSTSGLVGETHNLAIGNSRSHEYVANGILSHNCDEIAKWKYQASWDNLMFGLRLGKDPRVVATTTPRPTKLIRELIRDPNCVLTRGSTYENYENLPQVFIQQIIARYEGTRLGKQELYAELLDDNPDALWQPSVIEENRLHSRRLPEFKRVVVGVDPSGSPNGAETGIVVAALGIDGHGYILDDASVRGSPDAWARATSQAYHTWTADRVVAEMNFGGAMVESTLRTVNPNLSFRAVFASRGKYVRAEPVAALYEQHRVHHIGTFPALEDQMVSWTPGDTSPDRLDALVWALTELMLGGSQPFTYAFAGQRPVLSLPEVPLT